MEATPIPEVTKFEADTKSFGKIHGEMLLSKPTSETEQIGEPDDICYYDPIKVYLDISDYFQDAAWLKYAEAAKRHYAGWVLTRPTPKALFGYWVFSEGLAAYLKRNPKDAQSKAALTQLATKSAFSGTAPTALSDFAYSRENAYLLLALLDSGSTDRARIGALVSNCYSHLDQWFGKKSASFVKSFMAGLTAYSLIRAVGSNEKLKLALTDACDELWDACWDEREGAFKYTSVPTAEGPGTPSRDFNNLITPMYWWVWRETGNENYLQMGDRIFSSAVKDGWMGGSKQFNQAHRFIFPALKWRAEGFTRSAASDQAAALKTQILELQKKLTASDADRIQLKNRLVKIREMASI
jgi:hypothetical protein